MPNRIRQATAQGEIPENSFKYSPLEQVRTLYVGFCQGLFAAAPLGTFHFSPSLEETEIIITDENPIQLTTVGKRPAVSFTRGPVQSYSLGQDDMLSYDFETGQKKKSVLIPGTMSINCCSRVDLESERLAWIIAEQLWMNRELLMRAGFFEIGRQFVIGSPSPAGSIVAGDSGDEWYCTTVSSPFQFYRTSVFTPLNTHIVEGINASYEVDHFKNYNPKGPVEPEPGTANLPYRIGQRAPGIHAPRVPHPLNPAQTVVVRAAHPFRGGLRPPAIRGRNLPIQQPPVEQSSLCETVVMGTTVKRT